jgi:hypothetical protein
MSWSSKSNQTFVKVLGGALAMLGKRRFWPKPQEPR